MDADLTLRPVADDEFAAYCHAMGRVFLEPTRDEDVERWRPLCDLDRFLVAVTDDGQFVGTAGAHRFLMSMPGADPVPCAGVTDVTVRPDRRRRGLLRGMMQHLLEDAVAHDEPWAALYASEGAIYGRFGFGPSEPAQALEVPREALATVRGDSGLVTLVDAEQAKASFPDIIAMHARGRGGMLQRTSAWWSAWLDHEQDRTANGAFQHRWHAMVPGRGYAVFRATVGDSARRGPDGVLKVEELIANDPDATAALWAFLASVDLVETVRAGHRPLDDPLPFLLANEAAVDSRPSAPLWTRLVDLPTALCARGFDVAAQLVLEVHDEMRPANTGTWSLEAAPDGSECRRTDAAPDVAMSTGTLATLALGGVTATRLADAGLLPGTDPAVVGRLDRLFAVGRTPWTSFEF